MVIALHPLWETAALPVPPAVTATAVVVVVVAASLPPVRRSAGRTRTPMAYLADPLGGAALAGRAAVVALLVFAAVTGRVGSTRLTENVAPVLVVGVGWPLLVLAAVALGDVWARVNPWDGLARLLERARVAAPDQSQPAGPVWWALPGAVALTWYLAAYRDAVQPRPVGTLVIAYSVVVLAGCLALGRRRFLARAEPVGLLLGWFALLPRRAVAGWSPPQGAAVLLGTVGGGLVFAAVRLTAWWSRFGFPRQGVALDLAGFVLCAGVGALVAGLAAARAARRGADGVVAAALVPVVAAVALVTGLLGGRAVNAAQLLVVLASDPFGWGWDLFGTASWRPRPYPLSPQVHTGLLVAVLTAGGVAGARIARARAAAAPARMPAVTVAAALAAAWTLAVTML